MAIHFQPPGYHQVTTSLIVEGAAGLIEFLKTVFDATERLHLPRPDGGVMHAELLIGDSLVMVGDAQPPELLPGISAVHVYVPDVDAVFRKALEAGATASEAPADQFYGDRTAVVFDNWGTRWSLATHVEDMSEEEMARRMAEVTGGTVYESAPPS